MTSVLVVSPYDLSTSVVVVEVWDETYGSAVITPPADYDADGGTPGVEPSDDIDGGSPGTIIFTNNYDGGTPDGILSIEADGGAPSTIVFVNDYDGGIP